MDGGAVPVPVGLAACVGIGDGADVAGRGVAVAEGDGDGAMAPVEQATSAAAITTCILTSPIVWVLRSLAGPATGSRRVQWTSSLTGSRGCVVSTGQESDQLRAGVAVHSVNRAAGR